MFDSIYTSSAVSAAQFFTMAGVSLVAGLVFALMMSLRVRSTKRFFAVATLLPFVVASVITFVNGNIGAGVAIGGAFALIRFRSAQGTSDEIATVLIAMASGIAFGMGYLGYGAVILISLGALFFLLSLSPLFEKKTGGRERLLRITIPESLDYLDVFDDTFRRYLKSHENVGVKTTGMGSMFRLSFKVVMKNEDEQKEFIDELRTKNGNLEIALTPYADEALQL